MVSKKGSGGRPKKQLIPLAGETIIYKTYDTVGMAKVIANYADDLPRADVAGTEHTVRVKSIGASYGYNVQELKASAGLGTNLPTRKGEAARRSIEVKLNQIAMTGDAAYNLHGMLTHPNIGTTTLPSAKKWAQATGQEIVADLDALWNAVRLQSQGVHNGLLNGDFHAISKDGRATLFLLPVA